VTLNSHKIQRQSANVCFPVNLAFEPGAVNKGGVIGVRPLNVTQTAVKTVSRRFMGSSHDLRNYK